MEECSTEFENMMIKGDLQEDEEQSIARYLAGLMYEISKTVQLQPYNCKTRENSIFLKKGKTVVLVENLDFF